LRLPGDLGRFRFMFLETPMRALAVLLAVLLLLPGCQTDFTGYGPAVSTTTPSPDQVQRCREVMYINPKLTIQPLGFFLQPGMDDVIRFKFVAQTNDPSALFDPAKVDPRKFKDGFGGFALDPKAKEPWWDAPKRTLIGGQFTVPPPNSQGTRGLNIGYEKNDDGTLTVFVLWHET
jgi:hypothetical protein